MSHDVSSSPKGRTKGRLKTFFTKGWPTRLGFSLGKYLPPRAGNAIANFAARLVITFKPDLYWTTRANVRHVLGDTASEDELDCTLQRLFHNAARGYYELFHNVGRGILDADAFDPPVRMSPETKAYIEEGIASGRGLLILGAHLSNFDLALIGLSLHIPAEMQALSLAEPPPGFKFFNQLREQGNVFITPITPRSLRDAMARLRQGGVVLTGVERPIGDGDEPVTFFGATARIPAGYVRVPMRTGSLVMTIAAHYEDGAYHVVGNPPMPMVRTGDAATDEKTNLHRILAQVEDFIRQYPDQWMMFVPVWRNPDKEPDV